MKEANHPDIVGGMPEFPVIKTLLIGIGNSGRSDDGLGWALAEAIGESGHFSGEIVLRYQLQIEDAELISRYHRVIFADAFRGDLADGFFLKKCLPARDFPFTTHRLPPETVLYLCRELFQKMPDALLLLVNGEKWDLGIGLSDFAKKNLEKCLATVQATGFDPVTSQ